MRKGWQRKPLGELCDILDSRRKPITKRDRVSGQYPYYGATGVQDFVADYIFDEPLVLVGEDGAKWESGENTAFRVEGKFWVNNHAHVLRPHRTRLVDSWLTHFLVHSDLTEFVSGLTVPKLNQGSLREIPIPLPSVSEQQRIVDILDEAFAGFATAKANAEKNLRNARVLFDSYLQSIFARRGVDWVESRLGQVAEFKNGLNYTKKSRGVTVRLVGVGDFQSNHVVQLNDLQSVTIDGALSSDYEIRRDDILAVRSNGSRELVGRCMIVPDVNATISFSGFIIRIRIVTEKISPRFLLHFLKAPETRNVLTRTGGGANISNINQEKLSSLAIPLPSLSNQKRLERVIETAYRETRRLESLYQRKLAALEELKKSLLHQAFTGAL